MLDWCSAKLTNHIPWLRFVMWFVLIKESEEEGEAPMPDEIQAGLVTPVEGYVCTLVVIVIHYWGSSPSPFPNLIKTYSLFGWLYTVLHAYLVFVLLQSHSNSRSIIVYCQGFSLFGTNMHVQVQNVGITVTGSNLITQNLIQPCPRCTWKLTWEHAEEVQHDWSHTHLHFILIAEVIANLLHSLIQQRLLGINFEVNKSIPWSL